MRLEAGERDDAALLRAAARGDEDALAALYDRHAGWLTARLTRRCARPDVVDHAVQDTFLAVWREAGNYRGGGDVAAFIWGIGVRRLIDAIRRDNGSRWLPWRAAEPEAIVSAEDQVLIGIEHGRLGQALAELSPELRGAIEATALDGLTPVPAWVTPAGYLLLATPVLAATGWGQLRLMDYSMPAVSVARRLPADRPAHRVVRGHRDDRRLRPALPVR